MQLEAEAYQITLAEKQSLMQREICSLEERSGTYSGSRNSVSLASSGRLNLLKASINHPCADASLSVFLIPIAKIHNRMKSTSKPKMWL